MAGVGLGVGAGVAGAFGSGGPTAPPLPAGATAFAGGVFPAARSTASVRRSTYSRVSPCSTSAERVKSSRCNPCTAAGSMRPSSSAA